MINKVYAYKTEDGSLFTEESDAVDYEIETRFRSKVKNLVCETITTPHPTEVIEFILTNRTTLFEIFKEELE